MTVFIEVRPEEPYQRSQWRPFEESVANLPNVISAYLVSGFADYD